MRRVITWSLLAITLAACHESLAQEEPRVVQLTLSPVGEAEPVLKYRLLPDPDTLKPGNAAVLYYRAILLSPKYDARDDSLPTRLAELLEQTPDEMDLEAARKLIDRHRASLNEVAIAAGRDQAVWDFPIDVDGISTPLPGVHAIRELAKAVGLKARIQILDQDVDGAVETLRSGFVMARHVGESGVLINSLVGIACATIMLDECERLVELPDAPNLYWALRDLGIPFVDMSIGLRAEREWLGASIPHLELIRNSQLSEVQSREVTEAVSESLDMIGGSDPDFADWLGQDSGGVNLVLLSLKAYPAAKERLIAAGYDAERIERMPAIQVVVLDGINAYESAMDKMIALAHPPYATAMESMTEVYEGVASSPKFSRFPLFETMVPPSRAAMRAGGRLDRRIAQLAVVEAIRMHAAENEGRLPASLARVDAVPVPDDPLTGRPFVYRLEGNRAVLEPPEIKDRFDTRYHITIVGRR